MIPQITMHSLTPQREEHESREHSWKLPQNQIKEVGTPMSKQLPHQRSCQDVCMDRCYQEPPQYAEINHHRPSPQRPVEVNEIGPTIQQGTTSGTETYTTCRLTEKNNSSCECTNDKRA